MVKKLRNLAFSILLVSTTSVQAALPTDETRELAKSVPLADLHMHVYGIGGSTSRNILRYMEQHNVRWGGGVGHYQVDIDRKSVV